LISGIEEFVEKQETFENPVGSGEIKSKEILAKLKGIPAACIGPVTAEKAEEYGLNVKITAAEYTIEGLFAAILESNSSEGDF
ncbi:MAG: uroporphyrinogen-III synthase, partial [bacterium]